MNNSIKEKITREANFIVLESSEPGAANIGLISNSTSAYLKDVLGDAEFCWVSKGLQSVIDSYDFSDIWNKFIHKEISLELLSQFKDAIDGEVSRLEANGEPTLKQRIRDELETKMTKHEDKNGTLLKINDTIEVNGTHWKLENISGVSMAVRRSDMKIVETKVLRKFDFTKAVKV